MRKSARAIAVGTVFVWQTREYEVDDITAAINGPFQAAPQSRKSQWAGDSILVERLPSCIIVSLPAQIPSLRRFAPCNF
jgi:hypothetical protein